MAFDKTTAAPALREAPEALSPATMQTLSVLMQEIMRPVLANFGELLTRNTTAIEQISAQLTAQTDRLEAVEKQIRLNTPITAKQATWLNEAIRKRAREHLDRHELADDRKAVTKLGNAVRRDVLARYGAASLREIPRHEYPVALSQIERWNNMLTIRDVIKEARARAEKRDLPGAGGAVGVDGAEAVAGAGDQPDQPGAAGAGGEVGA